MAVMSRLMPLMALSSFVICLLAVLATPTSALTAEHAHVARGHDSIAKRKRNVAKRAKRCRPKTTSLSYGPTAPASTHAASTTHVASTSVAYTHAPTTSKAPATTATTSHAVTTSVAAPPSTGGGGAGLDPNRKVLMSWPNGKWDLGKWKGGKNIGGVYSWSPDNPVPGSGADYPFFPMLWGFNQENSFSKIDPSKYNLVFAMNEPNQDGQSDMTPQQGVDLWRKHMTPAGAKGCKLVSPATTSAPSGLQWMKDFKKLCPDCRFDYVAIHWYDVSIDAFKKYVKSFHDEFGVPIIISEYACQNFNGGAQCTKDETWALHTEMAKWFMNTEWVAMFSPFGMMREMQGVNVFNQMMNDDGTPNDLGYFYLNGNLRG